MNEEYRGTTRAFPASGGERLQQDAAAPVLLRDERVQEDEWGLHGHGGERGQQDDDVTVLLRGTCERGEQRRREACPGPVEQHVHVRGRREQPGLAEREDNIFMPPTRRSTGKQERGEDKRTQHGRSRYTDLWWIQQSALDLRIAKELEDEAASFCINC